MSTLGLQNLVVQGGTVSVDIVDGNQINTSEFSTDRRFTTSISWPIFLPQVLLSHAEASGGHIHQSIVTQCFALLSAISYR